MVVGLAQHVVDLPGRPILELAGASSVESLRHGFHRFLLPSILAIVDPPVVDYSTGLDCDPWWSEPTPCQREATLGEMVGWGVGDMMVKHPTLKLEVEGG